MSHLTAIHSTPSVHPSSQRTHPTLGVVAMCFNEERDLPGFLSHLVPWIDEIVLVDDGSTDRTLEIASNFGPKVRVLRTPRERGEYYSNQRNKGIAAATSEWLLHMDIDERITPEFRRELLEAIARQEIDGFRISRLNFFLHRPIRGCGWQIWSNIRLARRDKFKFGGKIHETSLLDAPSHRVGKIRSRVWHFNEDIFQKRQRKGVTYSSVAAEDILEAKVTVRWWHLAVRPPLEFFKNYIVLLGFRDGIAGLILCMHSMCSVFDAYALAWDAQNRIPREALEAKFTAQK